jgi:hypothetical protein
MDTAVFSIIEKTRGRWRGRGRWRKFCTTRFEFLPLCKLRFRALSIHNEIADLLVLIARMAESGNGSMRCSLGVGAVEWAL